VVYADLAENETGRVIYLRKREKLLLRVQGRSPNDDAASFRIKFAGSFVASTDTGDQPELPKAVAENEGGIRVNSVGTIIEMPKPSPSPVTDIAGSRKTDEPEVAAAEKPVPEPINKEQISSEAVEPKKTLEVIVTDTLPEPEKAAAPKRGRARTAKTRKGRPPKSQPKPETSDVNASEKSETTAKTPSKTAVRKEKAPDPLENIRLVILFKDGKVIERPMSEVFRFSVDKGMLTVTSKDGSIGRYSILEVAKVTIE
ncbi:MAG: hypothetical protein H7070_12460, partial [Saprospiraceae bacterium]|nr:hypothetical protein [Pyrinomonadaceae bacterium]